MRLNRAFLKVNGMGPWRTFWGEGLPARTIAPLRLGQALCEILGPEVNAEVMLTSRSSSTKPAGVPGMHVHACACVCKGRVDSAAIW